MAIRLCDALRAAGNQSPEEMRGVLASLFSNVDSAFASQKYEEVLYANGLCSVSRLRLCNQGVLEGLGLSVGDSLMTLECLRYGGPRNNACQQHKFTL